MPIKFRKSAFPLNANNNRAECAFSLNMLTTIVPSVHFPWMLTTIVPSVHFPWMLATIVLSVHFPWMTTTIVLSVHFPWMLTIIVLSVNTNQPGENSDNKLKKNTVGFNIYMHDLKRKEQHNCFATIFKIQRHSYGGSDAVVKWSLSRIFQLELRGALLLAALNI